MSEAEFHDLFPLGADDVAYRRLGADHVSIGHFEGARIVKVAPEALTLLAREAFRDCQHLLRRSHLAQLRAILGDPEASANDKFVAFDLLKNANIAAGRVLPMCQDTGTAIVMGKKGQQVWTGGDDAASLSAGIRRTYTETNLRYSQLAPLSMYEEVNTGDNLPAQIDLFTEPGEEYKFLFIAKGGGSANKSFLYQQTMDIAHAKLQERLDRGAGLPDYFKNHPVYYAGPAKTPAGYASGSFGPTTAGRMDSYVDAFMAKGGGFVTLAKGNRGSEVRAACKTHGGFYLGSVGGPAARLARDCIRKVEIVEYPELGMEAIWRIEVVDFPAFIAIDDKGNDFFAALSREPSGAGDRAPRSQ